MYACVVAKSENDKIQLGFKVITDDTQPFDENGSPRKGMQSKTVWDPDDYTKIWDRDFSHVTQEADTATLVATEVKKSSKLKKRTKTAGPKKVPNEMFVDSDEESEQEVDMEREERMSSKAHGKATVAKTRPGPMMVVLDDEEDGDVEM
jgi:hypothetical protein